MTKLLTWLKNNLSGTSNQVKGAWVKAFAILLDVSVPLIVTMTQFPIWVMASAEATVSGSFIVFGALSCVPFLKQIKEYMKSPANWVLWIVIAVLCGALKAIIDEMFIVAVWGAIANIIGAFIYNVGKKIQNKDKERVIVDS